MFWRGGSKQKLEGIMPIVEFRRIEKVANRCGGRAVIAGTRIRVCVILRWIRLGMSIDDIHEMYPQLQQADIVDALDYAADHRDEIARDIADDDLDELLRIAAPDRLHAEMDCGPSVLDVAN